MVHLHVLTMPGNVSVKVKPIEGGQYEDEDGTIYAETMRIGDFIYAEPVEAKVGKPESTEAEPEALSEPEAPEEDETEPQDEGKPLEA